MSAEDAKEWGLIDEILESRGKAEDSRNEIAPNSCFRMRVFRDCGAGHCA
jgi:enoyl-CoA hydratase/carnithine racemase